MDMNEDQLSDELTDLLTKLKKGKAFDDAVHLLYDQALMLEGVKVDDPIGFVKRLNNMMAKSL